MVEAILKFLLDKDKRSVGVHELVQEAPESDDNLRYPEDGSIPMAIRDVLFPVADRSNAVAESCSTHAHWNLGPETAIGDGNDGCDGNGNSTPASE